MSPTQILDAVADAYVSCVSYRDSGHVVTRFVHQAAEKDYSSALAFKTAFVRPNQFRFEFSSDKGRRYLVWSQGDEVKTWWDVTPGVKEKESLSMALAGATGVSGGSAHTVPALLVPDQVGWVKLTHLADIASVGDQMLGGVTCYRLRGRLAIPWVDSTSKEEYRQWVFRVTGQFPERHVEGPLTLWIDRGTFLIRRIEEYTQYETYRSEEVTTYESAFSVPISEDELRFDPPAT
jgi:hypothetical protein